MQWIGKPQLRLSLEPIIGNDFDLKLMLPPVKRLIDESIAALLESFEKVPIDVPLQDMPVYVARYSLFQHIKKEDKGCQATVRELINS